MPEQHSAGHNQTRCCILASHPPMLRICLCLSSDNEEYKQSHQSASNGIGTSIEHLKQEDESFDDQNYRIDLESAVIVLMDYTISLGMYNTTHQLYISFLEEIAANSGITVDGYYQISLRRITMDAVWIIRTG